MKCVKRKNMLEMSENILRNRKKEKLDHKKKFVNYRMQFAIKSEFYKEMSKRGFEFQIKIHKIVKFVKDISLKLVEEGREIRACLFFWTHSEIVITHIKMHTIISFLRYIIFINLLFRLTFQHISEH